MSERWIPEEDAPVLAPSQRYERLALLGRGGMGEVWRVRDRVLERVVAMKVLREGRVRVSRLVAEARATAALDHPGIVPVYELGRLADGRWFYTMQEVRGQTLSAVMGPVHRASTPARWGEAEGWTFLGLVASLRSLCDVVAFAHSRGVVHRDLKPDNVMLGEFGEIRVVDWGLVKVVHAPEAPGVDPPVPAGDATGHGKVLGTAGFMPPEQIRGEPLDPRADVYALGAVLYCLLVGHAPQAPPDLGALELPRVPVELATLCRRAVHPDATQRPADAGVLGLELSAWLDRTRVRDEAAASIERAERAFTGLPEALRPRAREALLRLVDELGRAMPRNVEELDPEVLVPLADAGVLVEARGSWSLAGPELLRWPRLAAWAEADPEGQRLRHLLVANARGWAEHDAHALWRGSRVLALQAWLQRADPWLSPRERAFAEASVAAQRRAGVPRRVAVAVGILLALAAALSALGWWVG